MAATSGKATRSCHPCDGFMTVGLGPLSLVRERPFSYSPGFTFTFLQNAVLQRALQARAGLTCI